MGIRRATIRRLSPAFFVPAAILLVFVAVVVTLLFASATTASTEPRAWISAAGVSAFVTILGYLLNRQVAIRSVTIEAQKMLLEINKQYVAHPELLFLEGEGQDSVDLADAKVNAQLRAMAYLKLNVFEGVFAVMPAGDERDTWIEYFVASLKTSVLLANELEKHRAIYHKALIHAFDDWKKNQK